MTPSAQSPSPFSAATPELSVAEADAILRTHWGISGHLTRLGSERDLNFLVRTAGPMYVLKVANVSEPALVTDFQTQALLHLAAQALPVPKVICAHDGAPQVQTPHGIARLLTYLDGDLMHQTALTPRLASAVGTIAAQLTKGLAGFSHPAEHHFLQWDLKNAAHLRAYLSDISDPDTRAMAHRVLDHFEANVQTALAACRSQVVHNDLNPHNIVLSPTDHGMVCGIIDFGDMVNTALVCDLAVAAAYQLDIANPEHSIQTLVKAYNKGLPLSKSELSLVYDLIMVRFVTTLAITSHRAVLFPHNAAYIFRNFASASAGLQTLMALDRPRLTHSLIARCATENT